MVIYVSERIIDSNFQREGRGGMISIRQFSVDVDVDVEVEV